jgi:hypothetical protein
MLACKKRKKYGIAVGQGWQWRAKRNVEDKELARKTS